MLARAGAVIYKQKNSRYKGENLRGNLKQC